MSLSKKLSTKKYINLWLLAVCALVVVMIFLGGLTRLTDSGLSITQWQPISGVIPPFSDYDWQKEFSKYQASPEFVKLNSHIVLEEFKSIYWMEFFHRLMGRVVVLAYFLPLIFWIFKGNIKWRKGGLYLPAAAVFLLQGFMGWYMVKSGLRDNPYVSHYRLAMHLSLALLVYAFLFWQYLRNQNIFILLPSYVRLTAVRVLGICAIVILSLQIILGAFVAGLDAGLVYNSFPLMGDSFVPAEIYSLGHRAFYFSDPVYVQFMHRITAYLLVIVTLFLCYKSWKLGHDVFQRAALYLFAALLLQFVLGVYTILSHVHLHVALTHQLGSVLLLSSLLWLNFLLCKADE
jgi:cytochrome c oxidase assembly protein subunit 15